jgi:D-threo-aldose 1-dehydrogenase
VRFVFTELHRPSTSKIMIRSSQQSGKSLPRRPLGSTQLRVSEIGLGTAPLGNLYQPVSDGEADAILQSALSADINYLDCAPYYGFGLGEQRVGRALSDRHDVIVSTKVGRVLRNAPEVTDDAERFGFRSAMPFTPEFDYSYDGVMKSWESSLERLGLERVNILYVHDIGRLTHGDRHEEKFLQLTRGGGLRALAELRGSNRIDAFGAGVNEIDVCLELLQETDLDAILLAGRYTLLEQGALDELLPQCARRGTSIVVGGPYNSGILATGSRSGTTARFNYEVAPAEIVVRVQQLEEVCTEFGVPLAAAALQFPLAHGQVASVIPGLATSSQVSDTIALYGTDIPDEFWLALKERRMIREDAPVPTRKGWSA